MKYTVNEIDQALREKLRMNDTQFAWYLDHREEVIDKLKSYKKETCPTHRYKILHKE